MFNNIFFIQYKALQDDIMTIPMDDFLKLQQRVEDLEKRQQEDEDRELRQALAQFDYKSKTEDERKAWAIICKRLCVRK